MSRGSIFLRQHFCIRFGCSLIPLAGAGEIGASMAVLRAVLLGMTVLVVLVIVILNAVTGRRESSRRTPLIAYEPMEILGVGSRAKREAKRRVTSKRRL